MLITGPYPSKVGGRTTCKVCSSGEYDDSEGSCYCAGEISYCVRELPCRHVFAYEMKTNRRANDLTQQKGKKTINNEEILSALEIVELDFMIPQLKAHIERTSHRLVKVSS